MKDQLTTLLMTALGALVPVATALAVAWMKSRTEVVRQAALGAAHMVEATAAQTPMTGPEKRVMAVEVAMQRLPQGLRNEDRVGAQVEAAVPVVRAARASLPPSGVGPLPDDVTTPVTVRDKPKRPRLPG